MAGQAFFTNAGFEAGDGSGWTFQYSMNAIGNPYVRTIGASGALTPMTPATVSVGSGPNAIVLVQK